MADLASELEALAFRLRRAGEEDLGRELTRAMHDAVAPVPDKIRAGLADHMPDRYADELNAGLDIKTIARNNGVTDAVVSVYAQPVGPARKLRDLDRGIIHHPLFGDREHWYKQEGKGGAGPGMHPGWFTRTCQDDSPRVRDALEKALGDVSNRAAGG